MCGGKERVWENRAGGATERLDIRLRADPEADGGYFWRGIAKYNLDDRLGAERDFTITLAKNPVYTMAYQFRALTRSRLGNYDDAMTDFQEAIDLRPDYPPPPHRRRLATHPPPPTADAGPPCHIHPPFHHPHPAGHNHVGRRLFQFLHVVRRFPRQHAARPRVNGEHRLRADQRAGGQGRGGTRRRTLCFLRVLYQGAAGERRWALGV